MNKKSNLWGQEGEAHLLILKNNIKLQQLNQCGTGT